ncbi:hypothetical protein LJR231_005018 [Phyllobacterium sp. LjRoot231]|uniref:hypothetical protein n=1 Tax=Phyllobacterium sp. LjRoot231 TaxID=3342289 RepID=UPI003ECC960D
MEDPNRQSLSPQPIHKQQLTADRAKAQLPVQQKHKQNPAISGVFAFVDVSKTEGAEAQSNFTAVVFAEIAPELSGQSLTLN